MKLTKILEVFISDDKQIAVHVNPMPIVESRGPDPAVWCGIVALIIETIAVEHSECLVNAETGESPERAHVRARLISMLDEALEKTDGQDPSASILRGDMENGHDEPEEE